MHGHNRLLKVAVHDEVRVGQPDVLVMVDGIQVFVLRVIVIAQPRIVPLLLQQELHLVFLAAGTNLYCTAMSLIV